MRLTPWLVVFFFFQAAGCTYLKKPLPQPVAPASPAAQYERADAESLLQFADSIALASPGEKLQECQHLLQHERTQPTIGVRLRLFMAQLLLKDCGEISKNLESIRAKRAEIKDEGARRLFNYTEQFQGRLDGEIDQRKSLERQLRVTHQRVQSTHRQMKTRESEIKLLQDKLDALKSIEQNLGGSQDGN